MARWWRRELVTAPSVCWDPTALRPDRWNNGRRAGPARDDLGSCDGHPGTLLSGEGADRAANRLQSPESFSGPGIWRRCRQDLEVHRTPRVARPAGRPHEARLDAGLFARWEAA